MITPPLSSSPRPTTASATSPRRSARARGGGGQGAALIVLPEIFAAPFVGAEPDMDYFRWAEPVEGRRTRSRAVVGRARHDDPVADLRGERVTGVYHNSTLRLPRRRGVHNLPQVAPAVLQRLPREVLLPPRRRRRRRSPSTGATVGTIICYERHFPELGRLLALQGADVMCVPVACASEPTKEVFQLELRADAAFNSMFVVCANRVGLEGTKRYYGLSAIYGPDGAVLAQRGDERASSSPRSTRRRRTAAARTAVLPRPPPGSLRSARRGWRMMTVADIDAAAPSAGLVSASAPPPAPRRLRERAGKVGFALRTTLTGIALLVVLALLWEGYKAFGQHYDDHFFNTSWELPVATDDLAMPHVRDIIGAFFEPVQRATATRSLISSLIGSAMRTLITAGAGLAIAFAVGFGLAMLLLRFTPLRQGLTPWIVASQTVPLVAIAPMIVIWAGKANMPPWFAVAAIAAYLAFFPITVNTLRGLRSAARREVELMRSYAAARRARCCTCASPALPLMFTGLRLAATAAVVGAIVGELSPAPCAASATTCSCTATSTPTGRRSCTAPCWSPPSSASSSSN